MQDSFHVDYEATKQILSSLKEEQTDTPEQEMLPKVTEESSTSNAPVWATFPLPTITNVFSKGTPQTTVNLDKVPERGSDIETVLKTINDGSVPNKIGFNKRLPVKVIIKRLREKIWNIPPPFVNFKQRLTWDRECKSMLLKKIPIKIMNPIHIKELIFLKTDFDPFTKQMHVKFLNPKLPFKRTTAILLFSNNEDCMKVFFGLRGLVLLNKKLAVHLDWGGKVAMANNCIYPAQNETKGQTPPLIDNISKNDPHNETSEVQNNNSNNKDSTDKLATNETVETVPIKQEPADEVDISEPTEEKPRVTDLEIGKAINEELRDIDFDATIEEKYMNTGDMIETTNDAECHAYSNEAEGDTECTVVHVKGLPVHHEYDTVIFLMKDCNCFDVYQKIFYIRLFKAGGLFENVKGECLLKFTTHSDAVQVCDYLNKTTLEAKLDIGNVISESEELIPVYLDDQNKQPILAKFTDQWQIIDLSLNEDKIVNNFETYGLSIDFLNALKIRQFPLTNGIVITNLSAKVTEAKLMEVFSMAGNIKQTYMRAVCTEGNKMARIEYDHPVEAVQAISMFHNRKLYGKSMEVHMNLLRMEVPVGLDDIGEGLGKDGTPLKDVRATILEKKMSSKLSENFESRNGASSAANKRTCNKSANTDVTAILSTAIESLRDAAAAQGLLQSETNSKVFADVISALQKQQQSGLINKPDAASSYQIMRKPMVDTGSISSTYSSKSKKWFGSNTQFAKANPANISSNPQQNSEDLTNLSNYLPNTQNNTVNSVIEINKAPNASIFSSQPTNVCPSVQSGTSNATIFGLQPTNVCPSAQSGTTNASIFGSQPTIVCPSAQSGTTNETESYRKEKNDEILRKRDYEGKIKKGISGGTDDAKILKPVLYFRNLPASISTELFTMKMQEVGDLVFSQVTEKGRAIVCFKTVEDSERCLHLFHHSKVDGQVIDVKVKQKLRPMQK